MYFFDVHFLTFRSERDRYEREVDGNLFRQNKWRDMQELKRKARGSIEMFSAMADGKNLEESYKKYSDKFHDVRREDGKLIIRPFNSLFEAELDGQKGVYDSGMTAEGIREEDGYLFAVRLPKNPDKAFGYVLYGKDGSIKRARQAFGLDIQNEKVISILNDFSRDVLVPALAD